MTKIWRYFQFTKFLSMLEEKGLYFPNAASFDDPFEGSVPGRNYDERLQAIEREFDSPEPYRAAFEEITSKVYRMDDPKSFIDAQVRYKIELREKLTAESANEAEARRKWVVEHNFDSLLHY